MGSTSTSETRFVPTVMNMFLTYSKLDIFLMLAMLAALGGGRCAMMIAMETQGAPSVHVHIKM